MRRKDFQGEENFWPCVSDMFLALFIIALVLYSTMSAEKGKGDAFISEQAEKETCALVEMLRETFPNSKQIFDIDLDSVRKENGGSRPELAKVLYQILDCKELDFFFQKEFIPREYLPQDEHELLYSTAIYALYMASSSDGKQKPDVNNPCYDDHIREIRKRIEQEIIKNNNQDLKNMTDLQLIEEIGKLRASLSNTVDKNSYDNLCSKYNDLLNICKDSKQVLNELSKYEKDLTDARREIDELKKRILCANELINDKDLKISLLNDQVNQIVDVRINVMAKIKALLSTPQYESLIKAGVVVRENEGLIIVPSSAFSFPKATTQYYQQGRGIITSELEKRLEKEILKENPEYLKNLKLLALFLDEIGKKVNIGDLPVDNIAIECHTDNDVRKITDKKFYNDGLSLQRAFDAWRLLDKYVDERLSQYRNADKQGLFSMTGFGMRVLPLKEKNESQSRYEERCRRMQIRFNCSPKKLVETKSY